MNRRGILTWAAAAVVAEILSPLEGIGFLLADPMLQTPVTLIKTDGKSLKGSITAYDRDKVTMDVVTKPKDPPVSTDIPWNDIKRISNGLTRDIAVQKWKVAHRDTLCETCHGNGKIFCTTCKGTAHDPAYSKDCPTCKGAVELPCKTPKCDHGIIPCPNPKCLKLSDPGWYTQPDGSKWKKFPDPNGGYHEWSEHHVGQVIDKVHGTWDELGTCPVCAGETKITDPVCRGTSTMPCPTCSKKTKNPPCPAKCEAGVVECATCKGSGLKV